MKKVHLLVIDPQFDFCDPKGALSIPGADADMQRLSAMILRLGDRLDDIHCTLDMHHKVDVAHPIFWKDSSGKAPAPFTIISSAEVENGTWTPREVSLTRRMIEYVRSLETGGRYPLCIWPEHCLIGHPGSNVMPDLMDAFLRWEDQFALINYVAKGSNIYTEHYSGVQAEVPDPGDPSTQINIGLIQILQDADLIAIAGEAGSHCLANTVRDIANNFDEDSIQKLCLLVDATSPVPGFEQAQEEFVNEMIGKGMQTSTTVDFLL